MVKIVVLGAGHAGATFAAAAEKQIKDAEITVVDSREASIHKFGGLRAATYGDKFSHRILVPQDKLLKKGKVVNQTITAVTTKDVKLGDGSVLEFDYLICATGARNNFGEPPLKMKTYAEMQGYYNDIAKAIESSGSIAVIGGGPAGVELCGEILDRHPDKSITLISSGPTVISYAQALPKKFTASLETKLKQRGVTLHLGASVNNSDFRGRPFVKGRQVLKLSDGKEVECDLVLSTIGSVVNSEFYPKQWLNESGRIKVDPALCVLGTTNIFAIGDINDVKEVKLGYFAAAQGGLTASNLAKRIKQPNAILKPYGTTPVPMGMIVPVGRKVGATKLGPVVLGDWVTSALKGSSVFVSMSWSTFHQSKNLKPEIK